ncbi:deoxynucleoside triphosphate triphosphohydrolase SAMHD1-like [Biomphalaria glabrata]|uniref:Deoxynucleoside triphosphate triphosphohydrolase SAMHD1-like n=1 Tax=Biomphalaria glabrata TaxID=6526 RepID=A0A9W3AUU2_BIOGL|nr:deoxynucleoside triphosphate triphosphohydrolase SAMHD1-like [Biomphalaria glabrata]XP_055890989.1 deoxynucleoside triphosphate triphosphohydrolase SAMHD1-like [Biomphalaria glabrata]XP_055890990.1 deoxynucleoside triphosphate triphosphohydrolase SAMHD1-like [Biomphalaria glabrata]XP_055890991.1 deoxynucleoside triphosphate triphosphohydrolase SAMHD1-like [Biomphalaria glabrata]
MSEDANARDKLEDTPIQTIIDDLVKKGAPKELVNVLREQVKELQVKPLVKHIEPALNAHNLMTEHGLQYSDCLQLFGYLDEQRESRLAELKCKPDRVLKIFNDPIHGHIQLNPACQMIVDTPEFQRLRDIKQLGTVYFVYPGAAHNRFEHSLGVCHLAGVFIKALRETQPELGITDQDILCVQIAGLCVNLGHGPYSRVYTNEFLKAIDGKTAWPYEGRTKEKAYLYEIVVNRRNGIDVHKWDYMARDCHHLGIKNNFDASRYMKFARVIEMEGEMQICIRDKEISNLYNMFYTRYTVNKFAYCHRVTCGIELMIVEALKLANEKIPIKGKNGQKCTLYQCHKDMKAFTQLTDYVLFDICNRDVPEGPEHDSLREAQTIMRRIYKRNLYTAVYETPPMAPTSLQADNIKEPSEDQIKKLLHSKIASSNEDFLQTVKESLGNAEKNVSMDRLRECAQEINSKEEIIVKKYGLDFGMKEENPVERLNVYSKHDLNNARHLKKVEASIILGPVNFNEILVRVYSKDKATEKCFMIHEAAKQVIKVTLEQTNQAPSQT